MAVLDPVVLGLGAVRVAREPVLLAEVGERVAAAGDQLVHVGLVAGVPQEQVTGRVEGPVEGQGELDHAQVRAQVAAGVGDGVDDELPDLRGELVELVGGQGPEVGGAVDVFEDHVGGCLWRPGYQRGPREQRAGRVRRVAGRAWAGRPDEAVPGGSADVGEEGVAVDDDPDQLAGGHQAGRPRRPTG